MKNENDKVKAFALEVIEKWQKQLDDFPENSSYSKNTFLACIRDLKSLIPKEEVKTGSDGGSGGGYWVQSKNGEKTWLGGGGNNTGSCSVFTHPAQKEEPIDWSKASEEEKMNYANDNYTDGTIFLFINEYGKNEERVVDLKNCNRNYYISKDGVNSGHVMVSVKTSTGLLWTSIYDPLKNKWAEIIEPSTKTESEETKTYEVPLIERKIGDFVKDFLESNFGYDLSNETEDQRKYRIETIYSTIKALNLEQKARRKAEEMVLKFLHQHGWLTKENKELLCQFGTDLVLIDPKTL